jgi:beta-galactosidase
MKHLLSGVCILSLIIIGCTVKTGQESMRVRESFNAGWQFARFGPMPDGSVAAEPTGLEQTDVDDSKWRVLNLPHDWAIEGPFRADLPNRTGKLPWEGIGWYRKTFTVPAADEHKRVFIDFDGAMSNTQVWLNGAYVGEWPYGYNSFRLDLTPHLRYGTDNVLAVRTDNTKWGSRWYPGGGIYRNVWLVKTAPVHVAHWGTFVTTPTISDAEATVRIETRIDNQSDRKTEITVETDIYAPSYLTMKEGNAVSESVAAGAPETLTIDAGREAVCTVEVSVTSPVRWNIDTPNLYRLVTTLRQGGEIIDTYETNFGIRTAEFDADRGFLLNGEQVRLNGVCNHHDLGPLGAAFNTRAAERQLELLREMGCNAIRTAHNPPAPELLDLCDRMGFLVQDEAFDCWANGKTENDYAAIYEDWHENDLTAMVHRDRNHPSVIMWSTGNEVREQNPKAEISKHLAGIIRREDPTRPVTVGCNKIPSGFNGFQNSVDVFGYNYKPHKYAEFRAANPNKPLYSSESASTVSSRGEYFFPVSDDPDKGAYQFQVSSYDLYYPPWATTPDKEFAEQDRNPGVAGEFVWTGFDYLGEPTPYNQDKTNLLNFQNDAEKAAMQAMMNQLGDRPPSRSSYFGILDLCGFKKDRFYLYQSRWQPDLPMAHILPHWNWPERIGQVTPVHVYTSGDAAELFLNGTSLGRKQKSAYEYRLRWDDVVYQPGELKAVAYKDGAEWATDVMTTTGEATQLSLSADRRSIESGGNDLSFITVQISDSKGRLVPRSHNLVQFRIDGPGEIAAIGNGNAASHESFQANQRKAYNGLCLVIMRSRASAGTITLTAESEGLAGGSVTITTH